MHRDRHLKPNVEKIFFFDMYKTSEQIQISLFHYAKKLMKTKLT